MTDIVSSLDMTIFPIAGLVVFVVLFIAILVRILCAGPGGAERAAAIPLADERSASDRTDHR